MNTQNERIKNLVNILIDTSAWSCERDDAAMDLGEYSDDIVLNTLISVALNHNDDPSIMNACGESIATIWVRRNEFNLSQYINLHPEAQSTVRAVIRVDKPEWLHYLE